MQIAGFTAGPFGTNTYVVINAGGGADTEGGTKPEAFVVDPGKDSAAHVRKTVEDAGAELVAVVLTHGHIDHARDCAEFGLPVYIHPDDEVMLDPKWGAPGDFGRIFEVDSMKQPGDLRYLEAGETMTFAGMDFRIVHAPGHSPGSSLLIAQEEDVVFAGDVLFAGSVGRTDLPLGDPAAMDRTLAGPVWDLVDALTVLPGHGPATTVAQERATNPYLSAAGRSR
ncbi:MBL fold metallo-hydrolase [Corynebacterium sp. P8-C1]|uniref:MBL fold metallo-hydrolase n=1 Tax=Corynebacterium sp. P8-C1 TaxID=3059082 RepID=UPI00265D4E04|nr:MBL fold metallo-hydrolase [Corynebacterium sp. P8-C1]WKK63375.1 MBL fold metallo-hydrolase [Corynebacterium sp. P8-C1]